MRQLRAVALALVIAPAMALAQPSAKDKQKASDLVKKAIAKSQAGDHQAAADLYLEAYDIIPQPLLLSNIGSEYQQLKKHVEAMKYFCKYIEADPTGSNLAYATAQARTLYIELGGVTTVEDKDLCKPIVKPPPDPPPRSSVGTRSTTSATSSLDRDDSTASDEPTDTDTSESKTNPLRYVGLGVGIAGAGLFGLGVYYALEAKKISDQITNHDPMEPWPSNIKQLEADGESFEKKQVGFMVAGGIAVVTGVTIFLVAKPKRASERVTLVPTATQDSVGVTALGRF